MAKILLVEDETDVRETVSTWLSAEKYVVESTESGKDALQLLQQFPFDVIVLDWSLPDMTGPEILKKFRADGGRTPVIFLTGRTDVESKTSGLDAGADDFVSKPVALPELSARIRACLRRSGGFQSLSVGNVTLDSEKRIVTVSGERVHLTTKEYRLLEFMMRHPKQTFGARELLEHVWPSDTEIMESTVRVCVKTLRTKIGGEGNCILKTILGSGYIVDAD
ncbi:MAG TPA: response regulator transcription factor [Drouetiella sp.]|jgi:two-component system, OmpR family, phosphate regulon response regulator PhoB